MGCTGSKANEPEEPGPTGGTPPQVQQQAQVKQLQLQSSQNSNQQLQQQQQQQQLQKQASTTSNQLAPSSPLASQTSGSVRYNAEAACCQQLADGAIAVFNRFRGAPFRREMQGPDNKLNSVPSVNSNGAVQPVQSREPSRPGKVSPSKHTCVHENYGHP
eukprot:44626-Pelagomonas_calceolata.AAC.1